MDEPRRCRLSNPVHPHFLSRRDNYLPPSECFTCGQRRGSNSFMGRDYHYYCEICELVFHWECYNTPKLIRHPYHLHHSLTSTIQFHESYIIEHNIQSNSLYDVVVESDNACDWCGEKIELRFYRCLECSFTLHDSCAEEDPPCVITNPKVHLHPLTFFPRPLIVPCSACGLADRKKDPGYACLQCNYFVHQSCIDLPRVIKLTRHPHRLSLTSCLPLPTNRPCGVCYRKVDIKHGLYSCNKGCLYAVHSKCATHEDIWDGVDLEGVPEDPEEDVSPFYEVGDKLIKHFSHEHNLKFEEDGTDHDAKKQCQACCQAINSNCFYRCVLHCDFFLHAPCANLPKKKEHPIHKHPLVLQPRNPEGTDCAACGRKFNGFVYQCSKTCGCSSHLDVGCTSIGEPLEHKSHPHPLIISPYRADISRCGICGRKGYMYTLKCNDCEFTMCYECATIPIVVHYKHDKHPLTLCVVIEDFGGPYWCERCEEEIDPKKWFYTCNECCTTLHVKCLIGPVINLKTGFISGLTLNGISERRFEIAFNIGNTRPICDECGARCQYTKIFKREGRCFCSFECIPIIL